MVSVGDTFRLAVPRSHLYIVIAGPDSRGQCALVNCSSVVAGCDESCVLGVGDHGLLTRRSFVYYHKGRMREADAIDRAISAGQAIPDTPVSSTVLRRIRDGALRSEFTDQGIQALILKERSAGSKI